MMVMTNYRRKIHHLVEDHKTARMRKFLYNTVQQRMMKLNLWKQFDSDVCQLLILVIRIMLKSTKTVKPDYLSQVRNGEASPPPRLIRRGDIPEYTYEYYLDKRNSPRSEVTLSSNVEDQAEASQPDQPPIVPRTTSN